MTATFTENARMQDSANALQRAVMKLSAEGYRIVKMSANGKAAPSIQLDSPYEGPATHHQEAQHAEKRIGSCVQFGCRLYWEIKSSEAAA